MRSRKLTDRRASIDNKILTGGKRTCSRGQEHCNTGNFSWLTDTACGSPAVRSLKCKVLPSALPKSVLTKPGDIALTYIVFAVLNRRVTHQLEICSFGNAVSAKYRAATAVTRTMMMAPSLRSIISGSTIFTSGDWI